MKPLLLVLVFLTDAHRHRVAERFEVIYAPDGRDAAAADSREDVRSDQLHGVRFVLTNGAVGLSSKLMEQMPKLGLICTLGVGYENVPLEAARLRGIEVANAGDTNADCVADHAMAIMLAAVRRIGFMNAGVRRGLWRDAMPRPPQVSGRRLGVVGLGAIGRRIARRAEGFGLEIGYHNRRVKPDLGYTYFHSVLELATWSDFLVIAAPGGAETRHMISDAELDALGSKGVLVNVARGSLVDTAALARAMDSGRIAAAALDVYEGEPNPPAALLEHSDVILTPHVGGLSPEAMDAAVQRFLDNVDSHLSGRGLVSPVN